MLRIIYPYEVKTTMQIANPCLGPGAMSALARGPWIQACRTVCCARGQLVASWLPLRIRCRAQHPHQGQEDQLGKGQVAQHPHERPADQLGAKTTSCHGTSMLQKTLWPSGLRRWLKAPFRKGVGSNPTGVIFQEVQILGVWQRGGRSCFASLGFSPICFELWKS